MSKGKRPSRLAWFALDVDAFLEDPRMQLLTNKEKSAWAMMLIRAFRNQAIIISDPAIIAEQTGLTNKEAKELIAKLFSKGLLVALDEGKKMYEATSNRLIVEYQKAREAYDRFKNLGQKSAEKHGTNNLKIVK